MNPGNNLYNKKYRKDIDGLRALAILSVVLFHAGVPLVPGGFVGVDVFFVISGFLIGGILYSEMKENVFFFRKFYMRRIRRIAPALIFMLVICAIFSYFYLAPLEFKDFSYFSISTLMSVSNIAFWQRIDYFSPGSNLNPLLMTWSLGIEEQFYIFFPILLLLLLFRKTTKAIMLIFCITLLSFITSVFLTFSHPMLSFYILPTRAWELGCGAILAMLLKEDKIRITSLKIRDIFFVSGFIFLIISFLFLTEKIPFPGFIALMPVIGSLFIIMGNGKISDFILGNKIMVFFGVVSYSWYLWHWPLLSFARLSLNGTLPVVSALIICSISLFIAYLSYKYIETPFRVKFRFTDKRIIYGYLIVCVLLIFPFLWIYFQNGIPSRVSQNVIAAEKNRLFSIHDECLVRYGPTDFSRSNRCIPEVENKPGVALVGDSHAAALRGGIDLYANKKNFLVYQLTKSSCPFLIGTTLTLEQYPDHGSECAVYNKNVLNYILGNPNITEVVMSSYWDSGVGNNDNSEGYVPLKNNLTLGSIDALRLGLTNAIESLQKADKKIIIIKDVPFMNFNVVNSVYNKDIKLRNFVHTLIVKDSVQLSDDYTSNIMAKNPEIDKFLDSLVSSNVQIYDPNAILCKNDECKFLNHGQALYYDRQHLNYLGSAIALKDI
ncbi:acyltransferase family protein [Sodalis sp. dw_96]|uniref:acyltransferase family protein n=1 Tax=Sodalis sp. dw_96 TaxID=2719794 RepID=UPI001BD31972|nr:acyltransferase family protein [Sodalis sp. dw_96]